MIIIEHLVQHIHAGKWAELEGIDKKYNALEAALGFPPKRRLQCLSGAGDTDTIIIERQWESMAKMEATMEKAMADPAYQALGMETVGIVESNKWELFTLLP
jgi:hypothetical protein